MVEAIREAIKIAVQSGRKDYLAILIEVEFKDLFIAISNSLLCVYPGPDSLKNAIGIQFSDAVVPLTATAFAYLKHAIASICFDNSDSIPKTACCIRKLAVEGIPERDGISRGCRTFKWSRINTVTTFLPECSRRIFNCKTDSSIRKITEEIRCTNSEVITFTFAKFSLFQQPYSACLRINREDTRINTIEGIGDTRAVCRGSLVNKSTGASSF